MLWQHEGIRSAIDPQGQLVPQGCELSSFNLRAAPLIARDPNAASTPIPADEDVSVPDGVGNHTMGLEAHEEPAGSDEQDCTPIGTSNDPYVFSSVAHGDPPTPPLKAYVGDPVVIRQVGLDERSVTCGSPVTGSLRSGSARTACSPTRARPEPQRRWTTSSREARAETATR